MNKRFTLKFIAVCAISVSATAGFAQDTIKIANIVELSGGGATAGTNFKNGVELAVKEINASGGILGKKIQTTTTDTQSNPGVAKGLTQKAIDDNTFAIFGPVFSGSIMVSMAESRKAEVPNFTGGEAASITEQGNPYVFRTSFAQATAMPKVARYISNVAKLKSIAIIYVNNDFGKGGLDAMKKALANSPTKIVAKISTEPGQIDFSAAVLRAKQSNAEGMFAYSNEEESARILRELKKQGWNKPVIGETTHFRVFPGEGVHSEALASLVLKLHNLGYRGDYSFEVFNDDYQAMPLPAVAQRAWRSALWPGEDMLRRSVPLPNQIRLKR